MNYARECPLCRRSIALGRDVPIRIEDTNIPSSTLIEVHKQLWLLQELFAKNNQSELLDFMLGCIQRHHRTEIEKWVVSTSNAWSMEENSIKTVLVGNFISDIEFEQYRNHYTEHVDEFIQRCASTLYADNDEDVFSIRMLLPNENRL